MRISTKSKTIEFPVTSQFDYIKSFLCDEQLARTSSENGIACVIRTLPLVIIAAKLYNEPLIENLVLFHSNTDFLAFKSIYSREFIIVIPIVFKLFKNYRTEIITLYNSFNIFIVIKRTLLYFFFCYNKQE